MRIENPAILYPTLYAPATMPDYKLLAKMEGKDELVRRFVIDTEDAVTESRLSDGLANLDSVLTEYQPTDHTDVFVRLRNPDVTEQVLAMDGVQKLRGFVIPKTDPETFTDQADRIADRDPAFRLMPLLESPGMTDYGYRRDLLEALSSRRSQIDCLRIGINDIMSTLGMRRPETLTIYETVAGKLISDLVVEFRGKGRFPLTAPLFENFGPQYLDTFRKEVSQHVINQLFGQVVLHPRQLRPLWNLYAVDEEDLNHALYVTGENPEAAIGNGGRLVSLNTHARWARTIVARSQLFGVR